jgi:hypothetical protein
LHELSREELRLTNPITTDIVAQLGSPHAAVVELTPKSVQDRFARPRRRLLMGKSSG